MLFQGSPKLISQTVDSLVTAHHCLTPSLHASFERECNTFYAELKKEAQAVDANSAERFAAFELGELGTFRLSAKGNQRYPYMIENNDFLV